jgi:cytochrome P450
VQKELTPITAVTAADPYAYYDRLLTERPFAFDASVGSWVAASAAAVERVLENPSFLVRPVSQPVPESMLGTPLGDAFGRLVRMNDGPRHTSLANTVNGLLARRGLRDVASIARASALGLAGAIARAESDIGAYSQQVPASTVAGMLSIDRTDAAVLVGNFAGAIAPGATPDAVARGIEAAVVLKSAVSPSAGDDAVANALGFLFQSYDATAAAIAAALSHLATDKALRDAARRDEGVFDALLAKTILYDPPVHNTRRFAAVNTDILGRGVRADDSVLVLLAAANRDPQAERSYAFGVGTHACPGSSIALIIAKAGVSAILECGLDLSRIVAGGYRPSANVRMPLLALKVAS